MNQEARKPGRDGGPDGSRRAELIATYRDGLLDDVLPFWIRHSVDREHGGFLFALDRDGSVLDTDKPVWVHGRFAWLLATLYDTVEQNDEWLALARHGIEFLRAHCFDDDGRMFFLVDREGRPLRKRRYLFTEMFGVIALAAYARASGEERAADEARELFLRVRQYLETEGLVSPKVNPKTRPMKGLGPRMSMIVTAQELRRNLDDPMCDSVIDQCIEDIERVFVRDDLGCVLETVGANGELLDGLDGRQVNPGHSIETGWFILHEARVRGDAQLRELGLRIIDRSWNIGWDPEHGGLLYFRDARGLPPTEYWHDMKFWWPQCEAIIATLLAWTMTGDAKYADWHRQVHDWTHQRFPDPDHGEWFGYLHRDGRLSTPVKGNLWKGPFHVPRMQWYCWQLLETS